MEIIEPVGPNNPQKEGKRAAPLLGCIPNERDNNTYKVNGKMRLQAYYYF